MSHIGRGRLQCPRPYHTLVGDISEKQKKRRKLRKFPRGAGPARSRASQGWASADARLPPRGQIFPVRPLVRHREGQGDVTSH